MLLFCAALLAGFLVLFWSADQFVNSAIAIAKHLAISPLLIGLTVVSLGTSAPEIFVSFTSAIEGSPELAIGNALGSNLANIGLVLGVTAMIVPLPFRPGMRRRDLPVLMLVSLGTGALLLDNHLGLLDGLLLMAGMCAFCLWLFATSRNARMTEVTDMLKLEEVPERRFGTNLLILIFSLLLLLLSAELLVWAATGIAHQMGVSPLIIGLTIIAVGTSLPELVVSIASSLRGETDLAIGNIVGSNTFNLLAVLAIPGLISPFELGEGVLSRDYPVMLGMTFLLVLFAYGFRSKARLTRLEGVLMFGGWVTYLWFIYQSSIA